MESFGDFCWRLVGLAFYSAVLGFSVLIGWDLINEEKAAGETPLCLLAFVGVIAVGILWEVIRHFVNQR